MSDVAAYNRAQVYAAGEASDLRIPRSDALLLSHRDPTVSEVYNEVISLISIYKYYAIDIADPRSMQYACHIDLADLGVSIARG